MKRISKTEIKEMRSQSKKNSIMFAFTLPTVILYTIFFLVTMLIGVYYSFTDWNGISKDYTFVGLKNYVKVLTDERFREALWFNIGYTIALVVLLIVIPLTIALALNRIRRLSTLFRSIYFIPAVISMVTVGLIWNELFYRAVPAIGEMLNIEALSTSPLGNPKLAAIAIMVVNIWQGCAIPTVLFIAGLQSVPKDLLEAATIDGAGNWARFWNVIIPYLIPVLNMVIITQAKAGLTVFDYIKVMTNGGPAQSTEAVGLVYSSKEKIYQSYNEALYALNQRLIQGWNRAYFYKNMDGYKARIGKEAEIKLESIVRTRKEKEINQVIHSILEDIIIKEESAQKLYMAVVEILKILGNYYAELYQDEDIEELKDIKVLLCTGGMHFEETFSNVIINTEKPVSIVHILSNQWMVQGEYDKEENYEVFSNGYAEYNLNGKKYIIDKDLVPCQKNKIELPDSGELIGYDSK